MNASFAANATETKTSTMPGGMPAGTMLQR
jgi:hypothetical protein